MPVVTDQLAYYWNPKDGIIGGNRLPNLAPGGPTSDMTITGAQLQGNGSLRLDGVDDYLTFKAEGPFTAKTGDWTLEFVWTPIDTSRPQEIYQGGGFSNIYISGSYSDLWVELYPGTGYSGMVSAAPVIAEFRQQNLIHMVFRYIRSSRQFQIFINGTARHTYTAPTTGAAISAFYNATATYLFRGVYENPYNCYFHALRGYNKALSNAEITQNYQNGAEVGLAMPRVKIGEKRVAPGVYLPVYSLTNHESEPFRIMVNGQKGFLPLVPVNDPNASAVRVRVGGTTYAVSE